MRRIAAFAFVVLICAALGCKKGEPAPADSTTSGAQTAAGGANPNGMAPGPNSAAPAGGSGDTVNITPMGGVGAGPMTPVAGAEGVGGGGSAAGQVLKDKAKGVAAQPPSSVNQMGGEDN